MKAKIQVLSQAGKLIAVYVPPQDPPTDPKAPVAYIRAGKGQLIKELLIEAAQLPRKAKDIPDFHAALRKKLKLRK